MEFPTRLQKCEINDIPHSFYLKYKAPFETKCVWCAQQHRFNVVCFSFLFLCVIFFSEYNLIVISDSERIKQIKNCQIFRIFYWILWWQKRSPNIFSISRIFNIEYKLIQSLKFYFIFITDSLTMVISLKLAREKKKLIHLPLANIS